MNLFRRMSGGNGNNRKRRRTVTSMSLVRLLVGLLTFSGLVSVVGKAPVYVFNAFFMSMRSKFVGPENSIHCYVVEWDPSKLSWAAFRNKVLG